MRLIRSTLAALTTAALLVGVAGTGSAQVRVQKEAGGEVVRDTLAGTVVRVDTVYTTRIDTLFVDRVTVRVDTVTRIVYDTVEVEVPMVAGGSMYWGLGGGGAIPGDNLDGGFDTGFNATLLTGWRAYGSPWGVRLDATYNQLSGGVISGVQMDDASVMSGMLDATFDVPWGAAARSGVYLLGGVGIHRIGGFDIDSEDLDRLLDRNNDGVPDEPEIITETSTDFGVNAGLGFRFGVGGASLFLEGRWVNVFTEFNDTRYFPIVLGITF